MKAVGLLQAFE